MILNKDILLKILIIKNIYNKEYDIDIISDVYLNGNYKYSLSYQIKVIMLLNKQNLSYIFRKYCNVD